MNVKKVFILFVFLTSPFVFSISAVRALPENNRSLHIQDWTFVREVNGVYTYKLNENKSVVGTFHSRKSNKNIDWNSIDPKEFFGKINEEKNSMMALINIFDWEVSQSKWEKKKDHFELQMNGLYTDPQGQNTYFYENHLYSPKDTQQILVITPDLKLPKQQSMRNFLRQAKKILNH